MAVHGRDTPFYSSILKAVEKYIPEYKEPGTPDMTRFSTRHALSKQESQRTAGCQYTDQNQAFTLYV